MLNAKPEIFEPIRGFEGLYEISNYGRLRNARKIMKTYQINSGYAAAKLVKDGSRTSVLIHVLVARHFLPTPTPGRVEVNHKNHEKTDNSVDNLEWVTSGENKSHSYEVGWRKPSPPIGQKRGNSSKYHNVIWDAQRQQWMGVVRNEKKNHFQKRFDSEIDAARHVNWILDTLGLHDRPRNQV